MIRSVTIHCDGGARPNPGPAGAGVVVLDDASGDVVAEISESLGVSTNNEAEYRALILGLERALALGARHVTVRADSELVVKQVLGAYAVKKPHLEPLHARVTALLARFEGHTITHVRREHNRRADELATAAILRRR